MKQDKESMEILIGAGKELATTWLEGACDTAKDLQQMQAQVLVLQVASRHVITTAAFNFEMDSPGADGDDFIDTFCDSIKEDLERMRQAYERGEVRRHGGRQDEN